MTSQPQLVIVGAGPAGMAAAAVADEYKISTVVLDDQPAPGGQIYRAIGGSSKQMQTLLGDSYAKGRALLPTERSGSSVRWIHEATVWQLEPNGTVHFVSDNESGSYKPAQIILATGALERPMPFPGWTKPGVMTAGAIQIALKTAQLVPDGKLLLAGSGPLLYLLAIQLTKAGGEISALVDTTPRHNLVKSLKHLPGMLRSGPLMRGGIDLLTEMRKRRIKRFRYAADLHATGDNQLNGLRFTAAGRVHELPCNVLAIHNGVVPNVQVSRQLNLEHDWHATQRCWHPRLHNTSQTAHGWLQIAGDGGGVLGADAAELQGKIAAYQAALALNVVEPGAVKSTLLNVKKSLARFTAARPFIDTLYAPSQEFLAPADNTVVCRCEEVTAGDIRQYVSVGCLGPNQTKAFGRPGMGPCQGRYCGLTVSEIIAAERKVPMQEIGYYRIRPPIKPITLASLAALPEGD